MNQYNPHIHHRRSIRLKGYDYSQAGLYFVSICCQNMLCRFGEIVGAGLAPAHDANGKPPAHDANGKPPAHDANGNPPAHDANGKPPAHDENGKPPAHDENGKPPAHDENGKPPAHDANGNPQEIATTMQLNEFGQIAYDEWVKLSQRFSNFEMDVFQIMPNHIHGIIGIKTGQPHIRTGQPQGLPLQTVGDIVGAYKSLVANGCLEICKTKNMKMGKLWQRNYYENIIRDEQSYYRISDYIINNPAKWNEDKFYTKI